MRKSHMDRPKRDLVMSFIFREGYEANRVQSPFSIKFILQVSSSKD
jgi:hypothetical protein